mgnify:CR=1 FL=1
MHIIEPIKTDDRKKDVIFGGNKDVNKDDVEWIRELNKDVRLFRMRFDGVLGKTDGEGKYNDTLNELKAVLDALATLQENPLIKVVFSLCGKMFRSLFI